MCVELGNRCLDLWSWIEDQVQRVLGQKIGYLGDGFAELGSSFGVIGDSLVGLISGKLLLHAEKNYIKKRWGLERLQNHVCVETSRKRYFTKRNNLQRTAT